MFENMFNGVMGKIDPGCCRLTVNCNIAVKTTNGFKYYNAKTGNLTDCTNFVLDIYDDLFFLIPTRSLKVGDIVLINGKPMYILEVKSKNRVEAMSYEDSTIQTVIPERHAIMGRKFYGKIVSLMGKGFGEGKGGFFKNMLKLKMMSSMMGGKSADGMFGGNALPMMMLMGGGSMDGLFDGMLDGEADDDDSVELPFGNFDDDQDDETEDEVIKPKKVAKKVAKKAARK